ncbi:hypothetical protein H6P81_012472 [Aristolochia fimbriata]|uniref:Uncharacterized protein n=1 Tax=Aristolochia fimbriata TaxID=158543 RepID=A0AAV7EC96_ARIFI|nr:hypothetical protein H6P81_012472 [Aristolochia fimbriata]
MPDLDPRVAVHKLAVHPSVRPVKQSQRRFRPELVPEIEKEVDKLIAANFIREVKYPSWISNIVPVKKKTGQILVCVDFRDLNKACPKDDFPQPITELMVDTTTGHEALSFMDGSFGYNQIRMDPKDEELTAFRTPKGIFCYKVMPFGLKNAGATYQRAMQNIFDDFFHKRVECYVDDLVVKTKQRADHLLDLRAVFERLRRFQLKINPLKCAFGVTSGKFLGFLVHHRGIEIDQSKIDAIQKMPEPRNVSELKSFQGHLAYICRFISNLAGRCQPFSRLLKKGTPFEWDDTCRNAFNNIKAYLTKPPVIVAPIVDKPLLLYIAAQEKSVGALLAQCDEDNKERSLYYLSRTLVGAELNYTPIEKTCLALIFAVQKLRHYLLAHSTNLICGGSVEVHYVAANPLGGLAKWALLLSKSLKSTYVSRTKLSKAKLGQFLGRPPVAGRMGVNRGIPRRRDIPGRSASPWEMYFDGRPRRRNGAGAESFSSPQRRIYRRDSFKATQICSNNEAEYQAILLGLGIAVEMQMPQLNIYGDSALVIKQLTGEFEVKKRELEPLWRYVGELLAQILEVSLHYVPRSENGPADALAGIAASLAHFDERPNQVPICERWVIPPPLEEEKDEELTKEIEESLPISASQNQTEDWRKPIINFLRHSTLPADLRERVQIRRTAPRYVFINDVLYREGRTKVKATTVADFIRTQLIYRYGVPRYIVTDNGTPFRNRVMDRFCEKFCIQQRMSSAYNPAANGLAQRLSTRHSQNSEENGRRPQKRAGMKSFPKLYGHLKRRPRTPTRSTPYFAGLRHRQSGAPSRNTAPPLTIARREGPDDGGMRPIETSQNLSLDEQRLEAQQRLECYRSRMTRAFNKKVRLRSFQKGDLVLAVRRPMLFTSKTGGKFAPKWEGPYVVQEAYTNGAYKLVTANGSELPITNGKFLKRFYP